MILLPTAGAAVGLVWLIQERLGWQDHLFFAVMYLVSGFGITIGYHRHFTHRSFETSTALRVLLAVAGAMAFQGPVIRWVADHRRHHAFTDRHGDPHSPVIGRVGVGRTRPRLWHAHLGWLFDNEKTVVRQYAADLVRDPSISWVDSVYLVWVLASVCLPGAIGYVASGASGAWHGIVWAGLTRIFVVQHLTWSINSLCHTFGRQAFSTGDGSRNHPILAVLSLGEGWHNNHHAEPSSAIHSIGPREVDLTGIAIRLLAKANLIWGVRWPAPHRLVGSPGAGLPRGTG